MFRTSSISDSHFATKFGVHVNKIFFLLMLSLIIASCDDGALHDDGGLIGTWHLTEMLVDPGDGSGEFYPVQSDKTITFRHDGTLTSNGSLCNMSLESENPTSGTYSVADSSYTSADCGPDLLKYYFALSDDELVVIFPCIEPCRLKFYRF